MAYHSSLPFLPPFTPEAILFNPNHRGMQFNSFYPIAQGSNVSISKTANCVNPQKMHLETIQMTNAWIYRPKSPTVSWN